MKVAVTGATGFLGRYIVAQLAESGHSQRLWYRAESDRSGMQPPTGSTDQMEWVEGELGRDGAAESLVVGCDAVVHSALYHPGGGFQGGEGELLPFVEINVLGSLKLIEAARAAGVKRFVFISTCAVHDKILSDRPLDEAHPTWAYSHYGAYKAAVEQFVHSYGFGEGYDICALRPTGIYGLAHPLASSKWFDLVSSVVRGEAVHCEGGGKEVHAADVAKAVDLLLTAEKIAGEAYSCCDRYVSKLEVATLAKEISRSSSKITGEAKGPKHEIDTKKLRSLGMTFGGRALLEETISQMVAEIRGT